MRFNSGVRVKRSSLRIEGWDIPYLEVKKKKKILPRKQDLPVREMRKR